MSGASKRPAEVNNVESREGQQHRLKNPAYVRSRESCKSESDKDSRGIPDHFGSVGAAVRSLSLFHGLRVVGISTFEKEFFRSVVCDKVAFLERILV